jgi:hypothetical protein
LVCDVASDKAVDPGDKDCGLWRDSGVFEGERGRHCSDFLIRMSWTGEEEESRKTSVEKMSRVVETINRSPLSYLSLSNSRKSIPRL